MASSGGARRSAGLGARGLVAYGRVDIAVDEVGHDLDVAGDAEVLQGFVFQVLRDAGDAVALLNRVTRDRQIAAVEAHERDVGAMKRGDKGQVTAARGQHLARKQGAHGVWNGVVHVEQIEAVELRHFSHARGEGQVVGRELEERITGDGDFMVEDACRRGR